MRTTLSAEDAIETGLLDAIRMEVGLEVLRVGRHILRDAQRRKLGELLVRKLWLARVQTPAAPPGCLACLVTDLGITLAFVAPKNLEDSTMVTSVLKFDPNWQDPLAAALTSLDPWSGDHGISLIGCSYSLFLDNTQAQALVRFSNPKNICRLARQSAMIDVASLFVTKGADSESAAKAFLDRWVSATGSASASDFQKRGLNVTVANIPKLAVQGSENLQRDQVIAPPLNKKNAHKKPKTYSLSKASRKRRRKSIT